MTEQNKSEEARKGLIDSVKGKAKEVVGAVTKNDSLTAEGQLEQTQAHDRKEANAVEAVADTEAEQARAAERNAKLEGARERLDVHAETAAAEDSARQQQAAQKQAAEQAGRQQAATEQAQAEQHAQRATEQAHAEEREEVSAAAEEVVDAVGEHQTLSQEATRAETEADRLRQQADSVSNQADLP